MGKDTIYRQAAIDAIGSYILSFTAIDRSYYEGLRDAKRLLNDIPSAEPRWIPVTERLPEDDTEVIVSCTDDSGDGEFSYVTTGWHFKGLWIVNNERCFFVRAWQPLPEKPYREE